MEILFKAVEQTAKNGWCERKCFWCGEYFNNGDILMLVVVDSGYKKIYKKLAKNIVIHKKHWDELTNRHGNNQEELLKELGNHRVPRVKSTLTDEQIREITAFKSACVSYRFYLETSCKNEIHMRKPGTSIMVIYNIRSKRMTMTDKVRRKGLFDGLYIREIQAKIFNKMQEILGTDLRDDYTVKKVFDKAKENVDKMFYG